MLLKHKWDATHMSFVKSDQDQNYYMQVYIYLLLLLFFIMSHINAEEQLVHYGNMEIAQYSIFQKFI